MAAMTIEAADRLKRSGLAGWYQRQVAAHTGTDEPAPDSHSLNLNQARAVYLRRLQYCRSRGLDTLPAESLYHQCVSAVLRFDSASALHSLQQAIDLLQA